MRGVTVFPIDQKRLRNAIPKNQHYAVRMTTGEVPAMPYEAGDDS
jgi:hypothetical protein